ncbi:GNAT family N-acetyltransferase [Flavivirga spongiicola]|uniref:GNAT family N-acetyltransferase n=1 Tax=Flavivirga spongiicola TaxID=421621 RepID=A0ABU7XM44_9FLAO|nr:GNAT family N-acetyltransferase [Flavivirga sp. MEBiC05379]MDO5981491.1 GNAT family N-acetyltransferase [Flavivirga sp. MEBiC05379]
MIVISKTLLLQNIKFENHSELVELMARIYPPPYKHLWKNEDCRWYLNKCYGLINLKKELNNRDAFYYFVINNSKTVGILRLVINQPLKEFPNQLTTYLHRIYLSKEVQGKGIAQQLFNWSEKIAKQNDNKLIWLEAMDTQDQALKFYNKQGYKTIKNMTLEFDRIHKHLRGMLLMSKAL